MVEMEPWAVKETREQLRRMSGSKSVELMAELSDEGLSIFMDSIRSEKKNVSWKELRQRMDEILWKREAWLTQERLRK